MLPFKLLFIISCLVKISYITASETKSLYEGKKFPNKYLDTDSELPTVLDVDHYVKYLRPTIEYFGMYPNTTDGNTALCLYFTKSLLKRTLRDDRARLRIEHVQAISEAILDMDYILSHYLYKCHRYGWSDMEFRIAKLFQSDEPLVQTIGEFNKGRLTKWLFSKQTINKFIESMDTATLAKEKYAEISEPGYKRYSINIKDSDWCLSQLAYNPEPIDISKAHLCKPDHYCRRRLVSTPSIGYTLSHRLLNIMISLKMRRCFMWSEAKDQKLADQLCAAMYREVVYLVRRGYFARDLFLEHVALCATMGYAEFHRRTWFYKAASWLNSEGCMKEFRNFELNRTTVLMNQASGDPQRRKYLARWKFNTLHSVCDDHPTAIHMIVMSHAIRHAAHFMTV